MKALILNSGLGHRMGDITKTHPKCMTNIYEGETILSRQLKLIEKIGIKEVVITTGYFDNVLIDYCKSLDLSLSIEFVNNPLYATTNYIYSIYCAKELLDDDILLMHGDIVFDYTVLEDILTQDRSVMKVSTTIPLPDKDFKAVVDNDLRISKVGIEFFDSALEAQAMYKINKNDWKIWLDKIIDYCEHDNRKCYAENAFNEISSKCAIYGFDAKDRLCTEIDTPEDLAKVQRRLQNGD
jgi:phosphoenolpyruvate phosphomutase